MVVATGRGQGKLDPKPNDQDGGERTIEILAHHIEEAEILREQVIDRLEDELEIIHSHGSFGAGRVSALRHSEVLQ
jgi:hypothetical protein